jgi:hypothetical protein
MVLPNTSRFARPAGLGTKLRRRRLACGIFKCAAEVTENQTFGKFRIARDPDGSRPAIWLVGADSVCQDV